MTKIPVIKRTIDRYCHVMANIIQREIVNAGIIIPILCKEKSNLFHIASKMTVVCV